MPKGRLKARKRRQAQRTKEQERRRLLIREGYESGRLQPSFTQRKWDDDRVIHIYDSSHPVFKAQHEFFGKDEDRFSYAMKCLQQGVGILVIWTEKPPKPKVSILPALPDMFPRAGITRDMGRSLMEAMEECREHSDLSLIVVDDDAISLIPLCSKALIAIFGGYKVDFLEDHMEIGALCPTNG